MDTSSEMIHSLLPMFLVTALGTRVDAVGAIEGIAEATSLIVKVFSGTLSDYLSNRKWLAVAGYGLGAVSKPLFALAPTAAYVLSARVIDRIGKGIRGAPRDALVADISPEAIQGAAFGLRQALDTVGAFLGPLAAAGLMLLWASDFRRIFWIATIPGVLAVLLLVVGVKEPQHRPTENRVNPLTMQSLRQLSDAYWWVVAIGGVFALARFSEAFLLLRAMQGGIKQPVIPLVMVVMNAAYMLSAYPFGKLADSVNNGKLLLIGLGLLISADVVLAQQSHWTFVLVGVVLWGLHMGMTQGLLAAMVAHTAPSALKGTAFGVFYLISGIAMLFASTIAGTVWQRFGATSIFYAGAAFSLLAAILVIRRGFDD